MRHGNVWGYVSSRSQYLGEGSIPDVTHLRGIEWKKLNTFIQDTEFLLKVGGISNGEHTTSLHGGCRYLSICMSFLVVFKWNTIP